MANTIACSVLESACSAVGILPVSATSWKPSTPLATSAQRINRKRTTLNLANQVQVQEAKTEGGEGQAGKLQTEEDQGLATGKILEVAGLDLLQTYVTGMIKKNRSYIEEEVLGRLLGEVDKTGVSRSDVQLKVVV